MLKSVQSSGSQPILGHIPTFAFLKFWRPPIIFNSYIIKSLLQFTLRKFKKPLTWSLNKPHRNIARPTKIVPGPISGAWAPQVGITGIEKKQDENCTRMLRAILNKSWKQHLTKQQLYIHWPPISKTIQIRRTRYAVHSWRSKDELVTSGTFSYGPLHMDVLVLTDQQELIHNSSVRTQDLIWKTCQVRWMRGTNSERESKGNLC